MEEERNKSIDEKIKGLINRTHDFQTKLTYYMLAVDAACIGFSVNLNKNANYTPYIIPFVVAIIFWLLSFHFGIKELRKTDLALIENFRILDAQKYNQQSVVQAHQIIFNDINLKIIKCAKLKTDFLYLGVISFMLWYFIKLYLNT